MTMTIEEVSTAVEGQTLATAFLRTLEERATRVALRERGPGDAWVERTFVEYAEDIGRVCASLRATGVAPGDRVVLMMRNEYDFHVVDMASVFCGATPISIYNSSSPDQIAYLVGHSEAKAAVVGDDGFLERFLKVRDDLPALGEIVNLATNRSELFDGHGTVDLKEAAESITPESLATVIYTSGTTGPPKGVMISNYNVVYTCESLRQSFGPDTRPRRQAPRVLPPNGACRRTHDEPLRPCGAGLRGHVVSRSGHARRATCATSGPTSCSVCPAYGRSCTAA